MKRWISLLLIFVFLTGMLPADALAAEDQFTMTEAEVQHIKKLAGSETSTYRSGMSFSASMSAYQMYCWLSELSENDGGQAEQQFRALSSLVRKSPSLKSRSGFEKYDETSSAVDRLGTELNYYIFQLDEDIRLVSGALNTLEQDDAEEAVKTKAYRTLQKAERELNAVMADLCELQSSDPLQQRAAEIIVQVGSMMEKREELMKDVVKADNGPEMEQKGDFHFVVLNYDQIGFVIRDENEQVIAGAKVRVVSGGTEQTVTSDKYGIALFTSGLFELDEKNRLTAEVYVTCSGKRNYVSHALHLTAGEGMNIYLTDDNGDSYIEYMDFRGMDILHETETIYTTPENDADQSFKVGVHTKAGHTGTFSVIYTEANTRETQVVEKTVKGTADKVVEVDMTDRWCSFIEPRMAVTTGYYESGSSEGEVYSTGIAVKEAAVKSPLPTLPSSQVVPGSSAMINIPLNLTLLKSLKIGFNIPSEILDMVPVNFVVTPEGYFSLGISVTKSKEFSENASSGKWKTANSVDTWGDMEKLIEHRETLTSLAQQGIQKRTDAGAKLFDLAKTSFRFNFTAMLTGTVDPEYATWSYIGAMDLFVSVAGDATVSWSEPFMLGPVPVYAGFDFSVGVMFGVNLGFKFKTDNLNAIRFQSWYDFQFDKDKLDIVISPRMSISIYGGIGARKVLGFYIRAYAGAVLAVHYRPAADNDKLSASASINIGVEGVLELLFVKFQATFVDKTWYVDTAEKVSNGITTAALNEERDTTDSDATVSEQPESFVRANVRTLRSDITVPAGMEVFMWQESEQLSEFMVADPTFLGIRKTTAVINGIERPWLDAVKIVSNKGFIGGKPVIPVEIEALGKTIWPYGIPDDAYVADFAATSIDEVCRDGISYKVVAVAVMFAQHANDSADGTPTKCMGEMHYFFRDAAGNVTYLAGDELDMTTGFKEEQPLPDPFGNPAYFYYGYDGPVYGLNIMAHYDAKRSANGNDIYYFTASWIKEKSFFWHVQTLTYNGKTPVVSMDYSASADHMLSDIPFDAKSAQLFVTAANGKNAIVTAMFKDRLTSGDMWMITSYYDPNMTQLGSILRDKFDSIVHVEVDDDFNSKVIYLKNRDETGKCDVVIAGYVLHENTSRNYAYLARNGNTTLDARLSPAEISIVNFGATRALYYVEQSFVNVEETGSSYGLKAVYLADGSDGKPYISKPFYLVRFDINDVPAAANIVSCKLFKNPNGFLNGIAVIGKPDGNGNMTETTNYISFNQTLQIDVRASAIENPLLKNGETGNLLFNVKNTGNIPISRFNLEAYAVNSAGERRNLSTIAVYCQDPDDSKVLGFNMDTVVKSGSGKLGVSEFDYAIEEDYDKLTTVTSSGSTTYATNVLMPGETHSYRATFRVPDDLEPDQYDAYVKPSSISTIAIRGQGGILDSTSAWIDTMYDLDGEMQASSDGLLQSGRLVTVTAVIEDDMPYLQSGGGRYETAAGVPVSLSIEGMLSAENGDVDILQAYSDRTQANPSQFDITFADLYIKAQQIDAAGVKKAHIVLQNCAATPVSDIVVTASLDGDETFRYYLGADTVLDGMNTCSFDIPMETLTGGRKGEELVLSVACGSGDLNEFNNNTSILIQEAFIIVSQPEDQFVCENDTAVFDVLVRGGTEPYTYQWQWSDGRNGSWKNIAGANESVLTIEKAKTDQTGRFYRCVITDASGEGLVSGSALLSVAEIPVTGDKTNPPLLALLMLCSMTFMIILARKVKKRFFTECWGINA